MFIAPSAFAHRRLLELGTPVGPIAIVPHVTRAFAPTPAATPGGPALLAARLVPEKGIAVAIEACRLAGVELVVAGEGPERARLETARGGGDRRAVLFTGRLDPETLARLRATASVALVPSLYPENLPQSAVEALAAGLPVAGSRIGGMAELVPEDWLTTPGDASALAATIGRLARDRGAGDRALAVARARTSPEVVAAALAAAYGAIAS
jgi:glycosyltransferase involved in cell wall biosynthesis